VLGECQDPRASEPVQRLAFNPDFDVLAARIATFLAATR